MIQLHVLHDQVIGLSFADRIREVLKPGIPEPRIHRIEHGNFLIQYDVRIVRHTILYDILPLKQIDVVVIHTDITDIFRDFHRIILS